MQSHLQIAGHGDDLAHRTWLEGFGHGPRRAHLRRIGTSLYFIAIGQCENLPALDILHHGDRPRCTILGFGLLQDLFDIPLHITVNGQGDIVAIFGRHRFGHGAGNLFAAITTLVGFMAIGSGKRLVLDLLDAGDAIAVVVHAAKQRAHEIAIRIQSFTAQLTPDNTAQVQRLDAALDLWGHVFLQNHILPGTGQISSQFHGVHIQDFGQQSAHGRRSGSTHGFAVNFVAVITGVVIASNRLELLCSLRIGDDSITLHALSEHGAVGVEDTTTLGAQRHGQGAVSRGRLCGLTAADELGGGQLNHACRRHQRQCGADGDAFEREGLDLGELYDATNGVHWVPPLLDWYPLKSMDTDPCCGTMPMSLALSGRFATN